MQSRNRYVFIVALLLAMSMPAMAQDDEWITVTGADTLRNFMSGRTVERRLMRLRRNWPTPIRQWLQ